MRTGTGILIGSLLTLLGLSCTPLQADGPVYDVVIYGGTSAGIAAAIQAQRMGKTALVVSPDKHLGGLTAGGLGWTDSGRKEAIGGFAREFYRRIKAHYDRPDAWIYQQPNEYSRYRPDDDAMWVFEPHVAEQTFELMIAEANIPVHRDQWLDRDGGVEKDGAQIRSITMLSGETYRGRMFIDATYEGDLMAAAGVTYTVGREANSTYGETLNGVQTANAVSHQFMYDVSPYVVPGDPSSGLLPRIHDGIPGEDGAADHRVQAYNFRMCLTTTPENQIPFPKPANYDPIQYELLARHLDQGWRQVFNKFDPAPNNKTDTNNHGAFSTDNIGMNYDYPEASYERRREIIKAHEDYQKGLMWFLANDERVPEDVREAMSKWGLAKDEFVDNDHWPHQIYVREARRMVSDFVMTERHLRRLVPTPRPIGMGSYNMDSHNVQRYVDAHGFARNEGDIQVNPGGPYPISYGAVVPKASEAVNLLVPVAVSSSHIAYGSIRMEPVFMILGQSAATAAALALDAGVAVQEIAYDALRERLVADGQVLHLPDQEEWVQLFNGQDLDGWDIKITGHDLNDNFGNTFRVEDGVMKIRYDQYDSFDGRFGHIFYREHFSHYRIAVEYRFLGDQIAGHPGGWAFRNSGVMVHGQPAQSMLKDQDFPISIEVQLLGGGGTDDRTTANLCTPGTHVVMDGELTEQHCINSTSQTYHGDDWVRVEVLVLGDSLISHQIDGETVLEYTKPQIGGGVVNGFAPAVKQDGMLLSEGSISLQSESHPLEFRKVELLNLVGCMDPSASTYKSYYVKSDPSQCR